MRGRIARGTELTVASSLLRNYVFQRRFVQFNGRSLMYFGSDKVGDRGCYEETRDRKTGRAEPWKDWKPMVEGWPPQLLR